MEKLEYLEFEKSCIGSMNAAGRELNRKRYNITEQDLIEFYGEDYPGRKKRSYTTRRKKRADSFTQEEMHEQLTLFQCIFDADDECFVRIRSKANGEYYSYPVSALLDENKLLNILNKNNFTKKDLMYSLNTYNNMHKHTQANIFTINSFAIDVDYKECRRLASKSTKQVINMLERNEFGKTVPVPNIIEYANNIRLIYVLDKAYSTTNVNTLVTRICNTIGERLADYGAKGQPITTFGRVVNSINSRNNKKVKVMYTDTNKYVIKELQHQVLPPLPSWYAEYKNKTTRKSNRCKIISFGSDFAVRGRTRQYNLNRIDDFFAYVEYFEGDVDGRRFLCYQTRNHAKLAGYSDEEAEDIMRQLNNRFLHPLRWNVIEQDTRNINRKQYYYRSSKILEFLGIEPDLEELIGFKAILSETEYKRRHNISEKARQKAKYRNEEGLTKTEVKRRDEFILWSRMELQGYSYKSMARELGYSHHNKITRKINKVYDKINYTEILEEVKQGLYDDIKVAIG